MKNRTIINSILLLLLFTGCIKHNRNNNDASENKIIIVSPISWGQSSIMDTIRMTTICRNLSDHVIHINYIDTPCGCISVIPSTNSINIKDSITLNIEYVPNELGYQEKNIFVYFKHKKSPVHFAIKGRIKDLNKIINE